MHSSPLHCTYREVYLLSNASDRYFELFVTVIILNIEGTILSDMILKFKRKKRIEGKKERKKRAQWRKRLCGRERKRYKENVREGERNRERERRRE